MKYEDIKKPRELLKYLQAAEKVGLGYCNNTIAYMWLKEHNYNPTLYVDKSDENHDTFIIYKPQNKEKYRLFNAAPGYFSEEINPFTTKEEIKRYYQCAIMQKKHKWVSSDDIVLKEITKENFPMDEMVTSLDVPENSEGEIKLILKPQFRETELSVDANKIKNLKKVPRK